MQNCRSASGVANGQRANNLIGVLPNAFGCVLERILSANEREYTQIRQVVGGNLDPRCLLFAKSFVSRRSIRRSTQIHADVKGD